MPRYRLTLEYDGTNFAGWQRQAGQMSVQQAIEEVIAVFCRHEVRCFGAGRTDAGVHALGQVAHVDLEANWPRKKIREAANGILRENGHAVAVLDCAAVDDKFDARFSARRRHYRYRIICRRAPLVLELNRAWHVSRPLDADAMRQAAGSLIGHHDFSTFRDAQCQAKSPLRTLDIFDVTRAKEEKGAEEIVITAAARAFLHSQVRSMVGSLKLVGEGKWTPDDLAAALAARDRKACGPIAPPHGLYLMQVDY